MGLVQSLEGLNWMNYYSTIHPPSKQQFSSGQPLDGSFDPSPSYSLPLLTLDSPNIYQCMNQCRMTSLSSSLSVPPCVCLSVSIFLCLSLLLCLCLHLSVSLSLCVSLYVCLCLSISLSVYLCLCLSLSICLSLSVCLSSLLRISTHSVASVFSGEV